MPHYPRTCITYRPDQVKKVKRLAAEKRLSPICQEAIDRWHFFTCKAGSTKTFLYY